MANLPTTQLPAVDVTATRLPAGSGLVLRIQGTDYGGWLSVRVRRNLEQAAADFACEVTERWPGRTEAWQITPGDACQVLLDGELVLSGYVFAYSPSFDAHSHRVEVRGRGKTADLVDSAVVLDGGQLKGLTLQQIADRVTKPFGITVDMQGPAGAKLGDVQLQQGETVHALIERLARSAGLLTTDDAQGRLVLTRAGYGPRKRAATALVEGQNILAATAELDNTAQFSDYETKAQKPNLDDQADWDGSDDGGAGDAGDGGDEEPLVGSRGDTGVSPSGRAKDASVTRYRPFVVVAETCLDAKQCAARAANEARRRLGLSTRAHVTVQGWRQADGSLWATNLAVAIQAPWLKLDMSLLIAAVEFVHDASGTRTELELVLPDAFLATPEDAEQAGKSASGEDQDTKTNFWRSALTTAPGT